MRLPRVRFTVRRLMAAVAVLCLILGTAKVAWRITYCLGSSVYFAEFAVDRRAAAATPAPEGLGNEQRESFLQQAEYARREAAWAEGPARDWYRAATRPWRLVPANLPKFCLGGLHVPGSPRLNYERELPFRRAGT